MERFWKRFWERCWRGFGEVFGYNFDIILIYFSYYSAYRVGKALGSDLEVTLIDLIDVERCLASRFHALEIILAWICYYSLHNFSRVSR